MKIFRYDVSRSIPSPLRGLVAHACAVAARAWERSGAIYLRRSMTVEDSPFAVHRSEYILVDMAPLPADPDDPQRLAHWDAAARSIHLNSLREWKVAWWQFWRPAVTPELMAHEFGHALGLEHAPDHQRSVMAYRSPTPVMPTEYDFATLRRKLA